MVDRTGRNSNTSLASKSRARLTRLSDDGKDIRILLADDDTQVRTLIARILSRQGWQVSSVTNGQEAVEAWPADIIDRLAADNVFVSQRGDSLRISPHVFNDADDVDRFFAALDRSL